MTRREIRDCAFKLVFAKLLRSDDIEEIYKSAIEAGEITVNEQVRELTDGAILHSEELDAVIGKYSKSRAVSRISNLNHAILRIALYEALYDDNTPVNAAISEAILLSKAYAYPEDTAFINGILGSFARETGKTLPEDTEKNA